MRLDPTTAAGIDSPIGAALALLAERDISRDVEHPLLDLSQAAPPYPPAPEVVERVVEVARAPDGATYTPVPGIPPLRAAIADELSRDHAGSVEPSDVVVTAGCNQAFALVADALAGPGDEMITPLPGLPKITGTRGLDRRCLSRSRWCRMFRSSGSCRHTTLGVSRRVSCDDVVTL